MSPQHAAELIPFDQVHRLVQERRARRGATPGGNDLAVMAARTSQVRRLLSDPRLREHGPDVA